MEVSAIRLVFFDRKFLLKWQYEFDVALIILLVYSLLYSA